jgi:hypothetical protein
MDELAWRDALRNRSYPGATPKLTIQQRTCLPELPQRGAQAYGYLSDV